MTHEELQELLFDNEVYDAYQFIQNAHKTVITVCFCKDVILALIKKMDTEHQQWQENLVSQLTKQEGPLKQIGIAANGLPSFNLSVCDVEITAPFLLDKLTKDFFQYSRNTFDYMSQAANAACLATKAKKISNVDFGFMKKVFDQQTYSHAFPNVSSWYNLVASSTEFQYIENFNNRTKHTSDIFLKMSIALLGSEYEMSINPFYQKSQQHPKQDIAGYLELIYKFVSTCYTEFISALKAEIPKKVFIENRYAKIHILQQKLKDNPNSSFSMPYIDMINDIKSMPDTIQVLLVAKHSGKVYAQNSPFETIYVKGPNGNFDFVGKYVAETLYGEDALLQYRKYKKVIHQKTDIPLCFQAMNDPSQKGVFYHANMFVDIQTITDDKDFEQRVLLPF